MLVTMRDAPGVGLAANQVGVPLQVAVTEIEGRITELVNPQIVKSSGEQVDWEGCLSIPGYVAEVVSGGEGDGQGPRSSRPRVPRQGRGPVRACPAARDRPPQRPALHRPPRARSPSWCGSRRHTTMSPKKPPPASSGQQRIGRIAFLGTGAFGVPLLARVADLADEMLVVSQPDRPAGRRLQMRATPIAVAARERGIPVLTPARLRSDERARGARALRSRWPRARGLRPDRAGRPPGDRAAASPQRPPVAAAPSSGSGAGGGDDPRGRPRGRRDADGHDRGARCRSDRRALAGPACGQGDDAGARGADSRTWPRRSFRRSSGSGLVERSRPSLRTIAPRPMSIRSPVRTVGSTGAGRRSRSTGRSARFSPGRARGRRSTTVASTSAAPARWGASMTSRSER